LQNTSTTDSMSQAAENRPMYFERDERIRFVDQFALLIEN